MTGIKELNTSWNEVQTALEAPGFSYDISQRFFKNKYILNRGQLDTNQGEKSSIGRPAAPSRLYQS